MIIFNKLIYQALFVVCILTSSAMAKPYKQVEPIDAKFRLNLENVTLPEREKMGFAGATALYDVNDWLSLGPAAYGAVSGNRGGFITIGMALNAQKQLIDHLLLDGGFFLGAGGGKSGYTLSGGGLMLRGHAGLYFTSEKWGHIGAGASYIDFPNGSIHSFQPYIAYEYPFELYAAPSWVSEYLTGSIPEASQEISLIFKNYFMSSKSLENNTSGNSKYMGILGMQWYRYYFNKLFMTLESEGAVSGESSGYMQILLGGGVKQKLFRGSSVKLIGEAGVAGGGAVATGGGILLDGGVILQQYLTNSIYLAVNGDYVAAPSGDLRAFSAGLQLGYGFTTPDGEKLLDKSLLNSDPYSPNTLRVRATNQTYLQAKKDWRIHHANETINNLGIQLDYFTNSNFYLTGQGIAAYSGSAGAYMAGMFGPGLYLPLFKSPVFIDLEGLAVAAGGGGLNISGGFALQGNAGIGINLTQGLSLMAYYGYLGAVRGGFGANIIGGTIAYNFTLFSKPNHL